MASSPPVSSIGANPDEETNSSNPISTGKITEYSWTIGATNYEEISGTTILSDADYDSVTIELPFKFRYDDSDITKIQVDPDGSIALNTDSSFYYPARLSSFYTSETNNLAAWLLDLKDDATGSIEHTTIGSENDRVFVMQWKEVRHYYTYNGYPLNSLLRGGLNHPLREEFRNDSLEI